MQLVITIVVMVSMNTNGDYIITNTIVVLMDATNDYNYCCPDGCNQ